MYFMYGVCNPVQYTYGRHELLTVTVEPKIAYECSMYIYKDAFYHET